MQQVRNDLASKASTAQIDEILNTSKEKDERISKLEELVARQETMIILMDRKLDDIESYGRRQNLRIVGIIYMDLTKHRFMLKKLAQDRIKGNSLVDFVFADVNNNICLRLKNGQFKFFNSEEEFDKILRDLG